MARSMSAGCASGTWKYSLLGRRVDDVEDRIRTRFDPVAADEESVGIAQRDNGFGGHTHVVDSFSSC